MPPQVHLERRQSAEVETGRLVAHRGEQRRRLLLLLSPRSHHNRHTLVLDESVFLRDRRELEAPPGVLNVLLVETLTRSVQALEVLLDVVRPVDARLPLLVEVAGLKD